MNKPLDFGQTLMRNGEAVKKYGKLTQDTQQAVNNWANTLDTQQELNRLVENIAEGSEHDY